LAAAKLVRIVLGRLLMGDLEVRRSGSSRRLRARRRAAVSPATDDHLAAGTCSTPTTSLVSDSHQRQSSALFFLTATAGEDAWYALCLSSCCSK